MIEVNWNIDPTSAMKQCLKLELGLSYVNFKTIIQELEKITDNYRQAVNSNAAAIVI